MTALELRHTPPLNDPPTLVAALGLQRGALTHGVGVTVCCPAHDDRSPSCSVFRGQDGTVGIRCHGCGWTGDALSLIAVANGLDVRADWPRVREHALRLTGCAVPQVVREQREERGYPPPEEVAALWGACVPCADDADVVTLLQRRGLDATLVDVLRLARVLPATAALPRWASYRGRRDQAAPWSETGHRLIVPVYDHSGAHRSFRAWCVLHESDDPKRLPPAGFAVRGLVLADDVAAAMLAGTASPLRIVIVEGEPDFVTWSTHTSDANADPPAVLGVVSGSWTETIAARVPDGSRVAIRTHHDAAGDKYAETIARTLVHRCEVGRARAHQASEAS